jgi:VCBS repeat-containing protein
LFDLTNGTLKFKQAQDFESAAKTSYTANVVATDAAGNVKNQAVTVTLTNVNEAPSISSGATASVSENATQAVYTTVASDPDANTTLTYSLSGPDKDVFNISSSGVVTFKAAPNFEAPTDAGANNVYNITVTASDGTLSTPKDVAVTVTNVNEAPKFANATIVQALAENIAAVGNAPATDLDIGDAITYTLSGTDAAAFNINATSGALSFKSSPNYELDAKTYSVVVTATDTTNLTATQALTINVSNVDEKIEFRKGAVTSDVVTLEVWVDPGVSFGSVDVQLTLADSNKYSIVIDDASSALTFAKSGWTPSINQESPGNYLMGGFSLTEVADTSDYQKLFSIAVQRDQTADAIEFTMASAGLGDYFTSQPTDYIFSLV